MTTGRGWTRREFLRTSGNALLALTLANLQPGCDPGEKTPSPLTASRAKPAGVPDYRGWEDLYRQKWTWERVARGTHTMTNCVSGCAWNLYVKGDVLWREEQTSPYAASSPGLPDFNPRGCQKGACATNLMYSPSRIRYPLRRVGPRGAGKWQRVSWDEALAEVATAMTDAIAAEGPSSVLLELGPNIGAGPNSAAPLRFFRLLGSPATDSMAQIGDLSVGATITLGNGHPCGSSDDWWRSSYLVLWAFNPSATRIPDAHFLWEARYRGAHVVAVCPDLNNSAIHADLWLNPRPGTDAALALGAAQVVIEEKLYDAPFVAEQTDLPLLVRMDTRRFLRESDLRPGGSETAFFVWDSQRQAPVAAPGSGALEKLDSSRPHADLDFAGTLTLDGKPVPVRTVFSLLREQLDREYRPEQAAAVTGVAAETIRRFARGFARAPAALILSQWGQCKFLLAQRAQILLASLTGNFGRAGGGLRAGSTRRSRTAAVSARRTRRRRSGSCSTTRPRPARSRSTTCADGARCACAARDRRAARRVFSAITPRANRSCRTDGSPRRNSAGPRSPEGSSSTSTTRGSSSAARRCRSTSRRPRRAETTRSC